MSTQREFDQIYNLIGIKKIIIIDGNVDDIYEDRLSGGYINIVNKLQNLLMEKKFSTIFTFDQSSGLKGNDIGKFIEENPNSSIESLNASNNGDYSKMTTTQLFNSLNANLNRKDGVKNSIVIDFSNLIFTDNNLTKEDNIGLTNIAKTLRDSRFALSEVSDLQNCAIFITKELNNLPPALYLENPEINLITLPKPNKLERERLLNTLKALINVSDIEKSFTNIIDSTDGMTLRELSHLIKFIYNYKDTLTFEKIFNIYRFGAQVSPWEEMDYEKITNANKFLNERVIGQQDAVAKVSKVFYKAFTGLSGVAYSSKKSKPKGTLFFVGPTGVGKTELAKAITEFLFADESNLIRFDMSEYSEDHSDQKLIGAPPGYVGFEGGGLLTNAVKMKPFSVILFDEIEKASPKIFDKFLQILEDGRLTDNTGQTISFSETFIIFTSNIGASEISPEDTKENIYKQFINRVQNKFIHELNRPELLGRFGNNIIPFNFIKDESMKIKIVNQKLKPIQKSIYEKYKVKFEIDLSNNGVIKTLLKDADDRRGGRDIINSIETNLVDPLAEFIFKNAPKFKTGNIIRANVNDSKEIDFYIDG